MAQTFRFLLFDPFKEYGFDRNGDRYLRIILAAQQNTCFNP